MRSRSRSRTWWSARAAEDTGSIFRPRPFARLVLVLLTLLATLFFVFPFIWAIVGRTGPVSLRDLLRIAVPHGVAVAACTVFLVAIFVNAGELGFLRLVAVGFAAYAVYLAVLVCFPSKRNALLARLKRPLRTPGASP